MKKLIYLFAFVLSFSFLAINTVSAQNIVSNYTNCDFKVIYEYGSLMSCVPGGTFVLTAFSHSNTIIPIPDTYGPIRVTGNYLDIGFDACAFSVESPCSGSQQVNNLDFCPLACGGYTAALVPDWGVILYSIK